MQEPRRRGSARGKLTSLLVTRVTIPAPDPTPTTCGTCRNFRQLPNASGTSGGISPTTCGGQLPEDLPPLWQLVRCLLWVSVGVASIERAVHRRRFLDLSGEDPGRQQHTNGTGKPEPCRIVTVYPIPVLHARRDRAKQHGETFRAVCSPIRARDCMRGTDRKGRNPTGKCSP